MPPRSASPAVRPDRPTDPVASPAGRLWQLVRGERHRLALLALVAVLLTVAAIAMGSASPTVRAPGTSIQVDTPTPEPMSLEPVKTEACPPRCPRHAEPRWLKILIIVIAVIALGGIGAIVLAILLSLLRYLLEVVRVRFRIRSGLPPPRYADGDDQPSRAAAAEVAAALRTGMDDLADGDADPRRAVIGCWVRLEQVAERTGVPRRDADTPTDLVYRLLARHRIDRATLDGLAALYRQARYAPDAVDERMRTQALAALRRVRVELERSLAEIGAGADTTHDGLPEDRVGAGADEERR